MFFAKAGRVTQLTYFEVEQVGARSEYLFKVKKTSPETQELYLKSVRANFQNLDTLKSVQAL